MFKEIFEGELRVFFGFFLLLIIEEIFLLKVKFCVLGCLGFLWVLIGRFVVLIGDFGGLFVGFLGFFGRYELEGSFFVGVNLFDV